MSSERGAAEQRVGAAEGEKRRSEGEKEKSPNLIKPISAVQNDDF